MSDSESDVGEGDTRLDKLRSVARLPYDAATSKSAQRAYIGTALAIIITCFLFCLSTVAYILFYYNYVPNIGAEHVVHLQFGNGHPYGTVYLDNTLISQQRYNIFLVMHLPRTSANLATGNFMIDMALLTPSTPLLSPVELLQSSVGMATMDNQATVRSRRPAILTHVSPLVETAHKVANLLWFILGWKKESEKLEISMYEGVSFSRGQKNVPDRIQLAIEADEKMQFYDVAVRVRAEFRGLRWIMYNHRIISFAFFTGTFFGVSLLFAASAYFLFGSQGSPLPPSKDQPLAPIKTEPDIDQLGDPLSTADLSDTPRRFPAMGRREGLAFEGRGSAPETDRYIKQEEAEASAGIQPLAVATAAEADDEDDEDDASWRDSGIGTGRESDRRGGGPRRRKSSRDGTL